MINWLNRIASTSIAAMRWLALPLVLLPFLQSPLRDLVHGYSREANDLGQVVFALFVAVSVTAATRAGAHLAADALAQRYSQKQTAPHAQSGPHSLRRPKALQEGSRSDRGIY